MTLDLVAIQEGLDAALDYEEAGSLTKARAVVSLARRLMALRPEEGQHGGTAGPSARYSAAGLQRLIDDARLWIAEHDAAQASVIEISLERFRG